MTAYSLFVCVGCGFETRDMQEFISHKDDCKKGLKSYVGKDGFNSKEVIQNA